MAVTERVCEDCVYYLAESEDCHFYPPQSVPKFEQAGYSSNWPAVDAGDWCGHWAPNFKDQFIPGPVA